MRNAERVPNVEERGRLYIMNVARVVYVEDEKHRFLERKI